MFLMEALILSASACKMHIMKHYSFFLTENNNRGSYCGTNYICTGRDMHASIILKETYQNCKMSREGLRHP